LRLLFFSLPLQRQFLKAKALSIFSQNKYTLHLWLAALRNFSLRIFLQAAMHLSGVHAWVYNNAKFCFNCARTGCHENQSHKNKHQNWTHGTLHRNQIKRLPFSFVLLLSWLLRRRLIFLSPFRHPTYILIRVCVEINYLLPNINMVAVKDFQISVRLHYYHSLWEC
jgi:hypothetical protein